MNVFILFTNRGVEINRGSFLVFDSLRVGFPTAKIRVYINGIVSDEVKNRVKWEVADKQLEYCEVEGTIHHKWISELLRVRQQPFYLCDTDMVFWDNFEKHSFENTHMSGRFIPQWKDEFTNTITRPRLHTSLMYIEPTKLRARIDEYMARFPVTPFNPHCSLIDPICVPSNSNTYFYDTMSCLYHAIGGTPFDVEHLECYDHLNFGTIEDMVLPTLSNGKEMQQWRTAIYNNPLLLKGAWQQQDLYYQLKGAE